MDVKAEEIMTRKVVSVPMTTTLQELVEIMLSKKVSGIPVVDDQSNLVGIISKTDLLTHGLEVELSTILGKKEESVVPDDLLDFDNLLGPEPSKETVSELMKSPVVTVEPTAKISKVVAMMLKHRIHRVVITRNKKIMGIITAIDIVKYLDRQFRSRK